MYALRNQFDSRMEKQRRVWCFRLNREQPLGNGDLAINKCYESPVTISSAVLNGCAKFKKGGKNSRPLKKLLQRRARQPKPVGLRAFISRNLTSVKQLFLLIYLPVCSASAPSEEITNLLGVIHVYPKTNHMLKPVPVSCVIIRVIIFLDMLSTRTSNLKKMWPTRLNELTVEFNFTVY